eukprot:CFRG0095T1
MSQSSDDMASSLETQTQSFLDEREKIRKKYRGLLTALDGDVATSASSDDPRNALKASLVATDALFRNVKTTQEMVLDSTLFVQSARLAQKQAEKLGVTHSPFEIGMITGRLLGAFAFPEPDDEDEPVREGINWKSLGEKVTQLFDLKVPELQYMLGPVNSIKPKAIHKRARKDDEDENVKKVVPDHGEDTSTLQEEATSAAIIRVWRAILSLEGEPMCFFKFVVDPSSFSRTIENIFHLSFVVKQMKAMLQLSSEGLPQVCQPPDDDGDDEWGVTLTKKQIIMELNMQEWQDIKKEFKLSGTSYIQEFQNNYNNGSCESDEEEEDSDEEEELHKRGRH